MPFRASDAELPLTPTVFEILLALADGERHGYAILQAVERRLGGRLPLRSGTLYRSLARLLEQALVEERPDASGPDERRRCYRLTARGRKILRAEAERLADQVEAARARQILTDPQR